MNSELRLIKSERDALQKRINALNEQEREIQMHTRKADVITADEMVLRDDIMPDEANYVLGQSAGFVDGFASAINTVVATLASEYRDIPITEDELFLLVELGAVKERAWLKDYKQRQITEKSGWEFDFTRGCAWVKKEDKSCGDCESCEGCEEG